jgi:tRNA dimethylallyltransferase
MFPHPFTNALVLTGPTGSGKTRLGIRLSEALGAEIVSMDSMALYRGMDIGTAKPTLVECARVRHHLVDELDPWESASVAWWLKRAEQCCRDIEERRKRVLFIGGTPLYLKALLFGLFEGPPANPELRQRLENEARQVGSEALHGRLARVDPAAARRLHSNDLRRIVRALEVWELTGSPLSERQTQWDSTRGLTADGSPVGHSGSLGGSPVLWLDLPRQELYQRINSRVEAMFASGLVDEVRRLCELPSPLSREARQALGYKEVLAHLDGQGSLQETIERVQTRTRNFAKRQITWFRHLPNCLPATEELTWKLWNTTMKDESGSMKDE